MFATASKPGTRFPPGSLCVFGLSEGQRRRIDAISQAGGRRAIIENMPEVRIAVGTDQLGSPHAHAIVDFLPNTRFLHFAVKAGPSATGVKLTLRIEQRVIAANAVISALIKMITVFTRKRRLRTRLAGDPILLSVELLLPFFRCFADLVHGYHKFYTS